MLFMGHHNKYNDDGCLNYEIVFRVMKLLTEMKGNPSAFLLLQHKT